MKGFLNLVHNKPFSLGTFDPYVILRQFVSKINQVLTPLSFDSALTSRVGKQPLTLAFNFLLCLKKKLTAYHKVCMDFFRRKLIFMELTGMGQFHVIRMHKMLSLLMSPLLTQLMRQSAAQYLTNCKLGLIGTDQAVASGRYIHGTCSFYHRECHGIKHYRPLRLLPRISATIRPTLRAR